jgi:polysaccharide export outer membrane protein
MKLITLAILVASFFCSVMVSYAADIPTKTSETITTKIADPLITDGLIKQKEYHIGPLDLLDIKVLYSEEVSRQVRVDSRGNISLPLLGVVKAAGLTPFELEQSITNKLSVDLIQNPQVTVFIKEFTSQRMTVQGVVNRAGVYDFQGQATLLQAISMAGGLSEKADETAVKVIRKLPGKNEETLTYDINVIRENKMDDPVLENGDVVMIEEKKPISVQGAVRSSGIYYLRGSASLMQVLSQAGGASDAADTSEVSIASKLPDGTTVTVMYDIDDIKKNKVKDPAVVPGDLIIVGASFIKGLVTGFTSTVRGFVAPIGR